MRRPGLDRLAQRTCAVTEVDTAVSHVAEYIVGAVVADHLFRTETGDPLGGAVPEDDPSLPVDYIEAVAQVIYYLPVGLLAEVHGEVAP